MKTIKLLALGLVAAFGLYSCGKDKDDTKEEDGKVYLVKSISYSADGENGKITFSYDNNKVIKVTAEDKEDDEIENIMFSYDGNTITVKQPDWCERILTMDVANNVISKDVTTYTDYNGKQDIIQYSFDSGYLTKETDETNTYVTSYVWSNGNMVKETGEKGIWDLTISYSDIKNKTNLDFALWIENIDIIYINQFIKNVSKNIPNSIVYRENQEVQYEHKFTITLNEKGCPSKIVDGEESSYAFEYYD